MASALAASAYFDRGRRSERYRTRDRLLLNAAAGLTRFTATQVAHTAGSSYWYGAAGRMLRALREEGHIVPVTPTGSRPIVYRWADEEAT